VGVHIYTFPLRRGRGNINSKGTKLNFNPRIQTKFITGQVLIYHFLITEFGVLWIKVHSDPGMMGSSPPLLLHRELSNAHVADVADISPFFVARETRR